MGLRSSMAPRHISEPGILRRYALHLMIVTILLIITGWALGTDLSSVQPERDNTLHHKQHFATTAEPCAQS